MQLSIILITYNALHFVKPCLESLRPTLEKNNVEAILVDNGSTDNTVEYIAEHYPNIKQIQLTTNKGVAFARNRGIEQASGEYLLLLDIDTIANTNAIEGMISYLETHPTTGIVGCKLCDINGSVQASCKPFPSLGVKIRNILGSLLNKIGLKTTIQGKAYSMDQLNYSFEPIYLIGACQLIRAEVVQKIGLLDEAIFYGPEDADFCIRTAQHGYKVVYLPQYTIVHHWQRSTNKQLFSKLAYLHTKGLFYFYKKHK